VLSAGNVPHKNAHTSFKYLYANVLTIPYPAHSPWFPWGTISNFQFLDHVSEVWAKSYVVACGDLCNLTAVIYPGVGCALSAPSMSRMPSLTWSLLVNLVSNLGFALSYSRNRRHHIQFIVHQSTSFGDKKIRKARTTLAHTLTNNPVSHFGYWNPGKAAT